MINVMKHPISPKRFCIDASTLKAVTNYLKDSHNSITRKLEQPAFKGKALRLRIPLDQIDPNLYLFIRVYPQYRDGKQYLLYNYVFHHPNAPRTNLLITAGGRHRPLRREFQGIIQTHYFNKELYHETFQSARSSEARA